MQERLWRLFKAFFNVGSNAEMIEPCCVVERLYFWLFQIKRRKRYFTFGFKSRHENDVSRSSESVVGTKALFRCRFGASSIVGSAGSGGGKARPLSPSQAQETCPEQRPHTAGSFALLRGDACSPFPIKSWTNTENVCETD